MATVLVTGSTGFVGRHLLPALSNHGHKIKALVRKRASFPVDVEPVVIDDLRADIDWPRYLDGVETVVHLAALAHGTEKVPPSEYDEINWRAAVRLASASKTAGALFVFISSIAAQAGSCATQVLTEEQTPAPTTPYGRSKLKAERDIKSICHQYVILRPTLTYGQGVRGNMGRLLALATSRIPPPLGSLTNKRSLLAVENLCDSIDFVMRAKSALNETFIVADPNPLSTARMVKLLRESAGIQNSAMRIPPSLLFAGLSLLGRGDLKDKIGGQLVASVDKLESAGFRWRLDSAEGLRNLGAWYASEGRDIHES